MDVCCCRNIEEELCECYGEGVAHCVDVDVRCEKRKRIPCEHEGSEGLAEKRKVRPGGGSNITASGEIEEDDSFRVEANREAVLCVAVSPAANGKGLAMRCRTSTRDKTCSFDAS